LRRALGRTLVVGALALLVGGCASTWPVGSGPRSFDFARDTLSYTNELVWEYQFDERAGATRFRRREPPPDYALRCFAMVRMTRQFFQNARFEVTLPVADVATYRRLVHRVAATNPRRPLPAAEPVVIPGFADLREFSRAQELLLKEASGGPWRSYFQRGHWRMVFPFTRRGQERTARRLVESIRANRFPIIHVARFPKLGINHALLLFDAVEGEETIDFQAYDPNDPGAPLVLVFDRAKRWFLYPRTRYFLGGPVNVHEVYRRWYD
jgi:hypothetical protein